MTTNEISTFVIWLYSINTGTVYSIVIISCVIVYCVHGLEFFRKKK